MDQKDTTARLGLPWPEAYQQLRPLIQEQWGIGEEIYLSRKLSGGKSGALVYGADATCSGFTGQAILKFDHAPDSEQQEKTEAERHRQAFEAAPDYAAQHLPSIVHTLHHGDSLAILSTIAGRGLEYAMPWTECAHDRQLSVVQQLSRGLLEDWNWDYQLAPGMQTAQDLLESWLGYRLHPKSRLRRFLAEQCGVTAEEPSMTFEGHWYPNPLAFAVAGPEVADRLQLRAVVGKTHGDLHGLNVLVGRPRSGRTDHYLIDLAFYQDKQFLFYDHAYFTLSHLLAMREQIDAAHWKSILDHLSPFDHQKEERGLRGDDLGVIELEETLRREVFDWVDRHEANRLSYMESQYQLAQVAVGLNFANKRLRPERVRRMALLYAADNLKDYLKLNEVDWPKHGPPFEIEGGPQGSATAKAPLVENKSANVTVSPQLPNKPSIAVLPFDNMSGDPDQEYFSDGITEDIITELSRFHGIFVIARNSSFHYKGMSPKVHDVSRELGVRYVVEGSVRRSENRVRVNAQLIDAISGNHIWAERYDREIEEIFAVQDEVTQAIVSTIAGRLTAASTGRSSLKHPTDLTAYELVKRGKAHLNQFAKAENLLARELFEKAVELDPEYAAAHVWLGWTHFADFELGWTTDPVESAALGLSCARRATELDSSDAWAQAGLAYSHLYARRFELAETHIRKASKLNPNDADILAQCGLFLSFTGRSEEGIKWLEEARVRNPFAADWYLWNLGIALYTCARYESAIASWTEMSNPPTEIFASLAAGYAQLDRMSEARDCMDKYLQHAQNELAAFPGEDKRAWREFWFRSYPYKNSEDLDHLLDGLRKAGLSV